MRVSIASVADVGLALRATRRAHGVRLDDAAGAAGVGTKFAFNVEHGKETVEFGRVLRLLDELGIKVVLDIPDEAKQQLTLLREKGLKPPKPRVNKSNVSSR